VNTRHDWEQSKGKIRAIPAKNQARLKDGASRQWHESTRSREDIMLKQTFLCTALTAAAMLGLASAQADQRPTTDYTLVFTEAELRPGAVNPAVLAEITAWLAENFDLPATDQPRVELVPPARIAAFRSRGFAQPQSAVSDEQAMLEAGREITAVYDDAGRTIYLPEGWSGTTPAELSVLVHEMVHHLQNRAQLKYECPQAREKLAYAAQERWLSRYDRSLASEFEIDPFTLLVRTRCMG